MAGGCAPGSKRCLRRLDRSENIILPLGAFGEARRMTPRRKRSTVARRSPDKMLGQAAMALGVLEGTLLDIREGLESVRGVFFLSRPNLLQAIDELLYVSGELHSTRCQIGEARTGIRRSRSLSRSKPK